MQGKSQKEEKFEAKMRTIMQGCAARSPWQIILIAGLLLCFEVVFPVDAYAQSSRLEKIRIVERGAYFADADRRLDERSPTGAVNAFKNIRLIKSTVAIPGRIGTNFAYNTARRASQRERALNEGKIS